MNKKSKPIYFGVVSESLPLLAWQWACIEQILKLENLKLSYILIVNQHSKKKNRILWERYVTKKVNPKCSSLQEKLIEGLHSHYTLIHLDPNTHLKEKLNKQNKKMPLDFILNLTLNEIPVKINITLPMGIWEFQIGHGKVSLPMGFWEMVQKEMVIHARLIRRRMGEKQSIDVLQEGVFSNSHSSYNKNIDFLYWQISQWPVKICQIILKNPLHSFKQMTHLPDEIKEVNGIQLMSFRLAMIKAYFRKWWYYLLFYEQWNIGIIQASIDQFIADKWKHKITWLPKPINTRFYADPFLITFSGENCILYEDFDYKTYNGNLVSLRLNQDSYNPQKIMENPIHQSYPFVFQYQEETYCVPETSAANEIALYKAVSFPNKWEKCKSLVSNFPGIDGTIFQYQNRWWLFATDGSNASENYKLHAWYADSLMSEWKPHLLNPIKLDIRSSRPAGKPFLIQKKFYRPAQDCSIQYGSQIVINHIEELTPSTFSEKSVDHIAPLKGSPYSAGIHTISYNESTILIDGLRKVFIGKNSYALKYKLSGIRKKIGT